MAVFLIVGALGVTLIVVALLFGDFLDGVLPDVSLGDSGGLFSTEVIGTFLAAFGFGAALLLQSATQSQAVAAGGGVIAGVALASMAFVVMRAFVRMPTDPTPRTSDLVGTIGTVITRIPADGLGEVSLSKAGNRLKIYARAEAPIAAGTSVVVVEVTSPTSVVVAEAGF